MAKNYKETTTQAAVLRTSTKTLSFWCNIREAPLERFAELIEGNIPVSYTHLTLPTTSRV